MLSVFPSLFSYALVVPLAFRLIVGLTFLWFGFSKLTGERRKNKTAMFETVGLKPGNWYLWAVAVLEILGGLALVIGFLTQAATLVLSAIALGAIGIKRRQPAKISSSLGFLCLLFVITLSLLFLGPGFYAFDLPL
ncbi:MAG: DoxX family protein [Candidatus Taylorbacteria bacterium]|nr:DoxX family protein [Candidatus Taylorbacteria bacterium]